jgi:small-conductance mechanosensitive channel
MKSPNAPWWKINIRLSSAGIDFSSIPARPASLVAKNDRKMDFSHATEISAPQQRCTRLFCPVFVFLLVFIVLHPWALPATGRASVGVEAGGETSAAAAPPEGVSSMREQAETVKEEFFNQARSLFYRKPLGWNLTTLWDIYRWLIDLPLQFPSMTRVVIKQGRILGLAGSLLLLVFIGAVAYSLIGRKKLLQRLTGALRPLEGRVPVTSYPFIVSLTKVLVSALIPLVLLGLFYLIAAFIPYRAAWFHLTGRFLALWAVGALVIGILREALTTDLISPRTAAYGQRVFKLARLALLYALAGIAVIWTARTFQIRADIVAFLEFVISISITMVLFLLAMMKKPLMSLVPELPYLTYQSIIRMMDRFYYPFIILSYAAALLWCLGYRQFGTQFLIKTWSTIVAYLLIMWLYHQLRGRLVKWYTEKDPRDETADFLFRSLKIVLLYATVTATAIMILNLLGLLEPLQRLMSFPVATLGEKPITLWLIVKAGLLLLAFVFASRLLQAYLDYRVYPALGIDTGLGYALNVSLKYTVIAVGLLISLKTVGLDLRFLLVFAGAAGIGIGFGLQPMAADLISGFSLIFGGKIRKGDWVEVGGTLGYVTDIFLNSTRIRTRDNVEYLIPNSNFVSDTIVNYSLASPMIRLSVPVGASYDADPKVVEKILLDVASKDPMVTDYQAPVVRFVEYGDNSINFELLVWIDVRETPRRKIRSSLYFAIFEAFDKAGVEIPYPQRDLHIRSSDLDQLK